MQKLLERYSKQIVCWKRHRQKYWNKVGHVKDRFQTHFNINEKNSGLIRTGRCRIARTINKSQRCYRNNYMYQK